MIKKVLNDNIKLHENLFNLTDENDEKILINSSNNILNIFSLLNDEYLFCEYDTYSTLILNSNDKQSINELIENNNINNEFIQSFKLLEKNDNDFLLNILNEPRINHLNNNELLLICLKSLHFNENQIISFDINNEKIFHNYEMFEYFVNDLQINEIKNLSNFKIHDEIKIENVIENIEKFDIITFDVFNIDNMLKMKIHLLKHDKNNFKIIIDNEIMLLSYDELIEQFEHYYIIECEKNDYVNV